MLFWRVALLFFLAPFVHNCGSDDSKDRKATTQSTTAPSATPSGASASPSISPRRLLAPGILRADELVDLYAKTSGYVAELPVDIGDRVHVASLLLRISVPELQAQLAHAEATLAANRAKAAQARAMVDALRAEESRTAAENRLQHLTTKRKEDLFKQQAIPQQEWDEAQARLDAAEAQLKSAQAKSVSSEAEARVAEAQVEMADAQRAEIRTLLDYSRIVAPFDGVITRRFVDVGSFVRSAAQGATTPMLTIAKTDPLRLVLDIPEEDAPRVQIGDEVEFQVRGMGERKFTARISRTAQGLRSDTRTMQAEADIANADNRFLPGAYAQATLRLGAGTPAASGATSRSSKE